jgi:hypothetical protein
LEELLAPSREKLDKEAAKWKKPPGISRG